MTMPAARVGDMHVCPMVTGVVPHVGGPIVTPFPTVLVAKMPAARMTAVATCVGPPDLVVKGSTTLLVGALPQARLTDSCAHGGTIVAGAPTVLVGG
ncbi:MAG: PAAR domain-containing protein [Pseudomonadota bacterium]